VLFWIALPGVSVRPGARKGTPEWVVSEGRGTPSVHARFSGGPGGSKRPEAGERGRDTENAGRQGVKRGPRRGPVAISAQGRRRRWNHLQSRIRPSLLSIVPTCPARPSGFSARGALSLVALDSEGSSLTHALRSAILGAILFLATPHQRWPNGPLLELRSRGLHSLCECPLQRPLALFSHRSPGLPTLWPQPDTSRRSPGLPAPIPLAEAHSSGTGRGTSSVRSLRALP
ncbi:MAG: hypothetical protein ACI8RZ_005141, partial [Myxococcota bacterium]